MVEGQACAWIHEQILVQVFAFEFRTQVTRQILRHEITSIRVVRTEAMNFSEAVMKGRIKGAGCDQHAKFRNGLFEL